MNESQIQKKLIELDKKIDTTSFMMFSYIQAVLGLLNDKELTNPEEWKGYLDKSKQELAKLMQDAQFLDTMKDFMPEDGKGQDQAGAA